MLSTYFLTAIMATIPLTSGSVIAQRSSSSTNRYIPGSFQEVTQNLKKDATGALSVGVDGVLRSFGGNLEVIDYRQLDPDQIASFGKQQLDAWTLGGREIPDSVLALAKNKIDGRLITNEADLLHPSEKPKVHQASSSETSKKVNVLARQSGACAGVGCGSLNDCIPIGCMACYFPNGPPNGVCLDPNPNIPPKL